MASSQPDDLPPSGWESLGPVEQAREWEAFRPGTLEKVLELAAIDADFRRNMIIQTARHERRMDYIAVSIQMFSLVFGLGTVIILALTAIYYANHGAADQGTKIFGFGAGSIVAAFVGINAAPFMKRINRRWGRRKPDDNGSTPSLSITLLHIRRRAHRSGRTQTLRLDRPAWKLNQPDGR